MVWLDHYYVSVLPGIWIPCPWLGNSLHMSTARRQTWLLVLELREFRYLFSLVLYNHIGEVPSSLTTRQVDQVEDLSGTWNKELVAFVMRHPFCSWRQPHPFTAVGCWHLAVLETGGGRHPWSVVKAAVSSDSMAWLRDSCLASLLSGPFSEPGSLASPTILPETR